MVDALCVRDFSNESLMLPFWLSRSFDHPGVSNPTYRNSALAVNETHAGFPPSLLHARTLGDAFFSLHRDIDMPQTVPLQRSPRVGHFSAGLLATSAGICETIGLRKSRNGQQRPLHSPDSGQIVATAPHLVRASSIMHGSYVAELT